MATEVIYNGEVRYKKASLNHFATSWVNLDVRGKSSKELKNIIVEMKKVNRYLMRSIRALEYKKKEESKKVTSTKNELEKTTNKLVREAKSKERQYVQEEQRSLLKQRENDLKSELSDLSKKYNSSLKKIDSRDELIKDLRLKNRELTLSIDPDLDKNKANQYFIDLANEYKDKYDEASTRARRNLMRRQKVKTVKDKITVEVERKKTVEEYKAEKFMKYIGSSVSDRVLNYSDVALKAIDFLSSSGISDNDLSMILKANILGNFTASSLGVDSRKLISLEKKGLVARNNTGMKTRADYWFLTPDGDSVIKKMMDYISYGKTKL